MTVKEYYELLNSGQRVEGGSPAHMVMHGESQRALRLTMEINSRYHEPEELCKLFFELIDQPEQEGFGLFPPFYTDGGRNIHIGKNVFINAGCKFQDQGGIYIGNDILIGHNTVLATLNHDPDPDKRADLLPAPIRIEDKVWLGANVTVTQGVTIGEGAIVAAGAVVIEDVPPRTVVAGVPAVVIKQL